MEKKQYFGVVKTVFSFGFVVTTNKPLLLGMRRFVWG
jgi:hypothetical protein